MIPAHQNGCECRRSDYRGSQGCHASMEDRHAVVPAAGEERPDPRIQVRGICGRADVRPVAKNAAEPVIERRKRMRHLPMAWTAIVGLFLSTAGPAAAQTAPSTAKAYKLPRTAD